MIHDYLTQFADAVTVAGTAGTALIGSQIDSQVVRDLGQGQPVYLVITTATEIITGGSAGTIKFQLASDAAAAIDTGGAATVHFDTGTFVTDGVDANDPEMKAGAVIAQIALPMEGQPYERYLGILATIATTTVTQGAINAFLTLDPYGWKAYADGEN